MAVTFSPDGKVLVSSSRDRTELFQAVEKGDVKGLLVMCTNPGQSLPSAERYRKAMETMRDG